MKKLFNNKYFLLATTLIVGGFIGWIIKPSSPPKSEEAMHQHETAAEVWTCSMHPQIRQNEPGSCPICGMDLIPVEAGSDSIDPMAVSMSPTAMKLANVQTMVVGENASNRALRLTGKVQSDERLLFTQSSHISGRIEKLMINFTGEFVSRGKVIAYIYSPELVTSQEELLEAMKIKDTHPTLFESSKEKLKNWKLTENQIDRIVETKKPIEQFPILANTSGYVSQKFVNVGDYVKSGQSLYEIEDLSKVWVLFDVYETDLSWISKGDQVEYTVQSLPGKTFNGTITYIDPVIDPKTRVAKARAEVRNTDLLLKPEMFVTGTLKSKAPSNKGTLVVPKSAVMWTGKRSVVYVKTVNDQGVFFTMRQVTLGPESDEGFVIESGLQTGEEIAVNGTFSIDAAAQLAGKPSMMSPEGGATMTEHQHGNMSMETTASTTNPIKYEVSSQAKSNLKPVIENYLMFKNALVEDNQEKALTAANHLKQALDEVDMSLFKGDAHIAWMKYSKALHNIINDLVQNKDLTELRNDFIRLSKEMIELVKTFNPIDTPIYVQHCPMAGNNNGADWLSLEKEIRNPYFGDKMLTCGEIKTIIK